MRIEAQRKSLLIEYNSGSILKQICKRIVRESANPLIRLVACLYLYDQKEMNDDEFTVATGLKRKDVDREGGLSNFNYGIASDFLKKYLTPAKASQ